MTHAFRVAPAVLTLALALSASAFAAETPAAAPDAAEPAVAPLPEGVVDITPDAVEKLLADGKGHVYDVNSSKTQATFGVVPGAVQLGSTEYSLKRLAKDKDTTLVFYCANTHCTASHMAAKRAVEAGYKDVRVMSVGIKGWKDAGLATDKARG